MCTYPVQPICTFSCTSVFFINIYYPQYTVLHILSHCTSYTFYFIICSLFHSHLYLYLYSLVLCFIVLLLMLFLFSILLLLFYFFCTFHWADLSRPTFHYWLYPVWLCMWQIIKNLEPWYSTLWTATPFSNDPLWLTLFVEGVIDRLLDHYQVSSVPHCCGFKEQEIPRIYTVRMVIYWNSKNLLK